MTAPCLGNAGPVVREGLRSGVQLQTAGLWGCRQGGEAGGIGTLLLAAEGQKRIQKGG